MKNKSILLFVLLVAIIASSNLVSCHKYTPESNDYSEWMAMTEADSNPDAVRTEAVEKGMNYQFAYGDYAVTVYKGTGDKVGKVIEILVGGYDNGTPYPGPIPPDPKRRDTLI